MCAARSWEHFHKMLHVKLNNLLEATAPNKTVMVAVGLIEEINQQKRGCKG